MITYLAGSVREITNNKLTLEVNGVGFGVYVPEINSFSLNAHVSLEIVMLWNQEQGPQLFGFTKKSDKSIFNLLTSCSGCGPKLALAVIAQLTPNEFLNAIIQANIGVLSSVSGIGRKKAEQIILQLKDKIELFDKEEFSVSNSPMLAHLKQLNEALTSLGYSRSEITLAVDHIKRQDDIEKSGFDQLLRKALSFLAKKY